MPTGGGNYAVSRFQLAGALLPDAEVVPSGPVDRGPWPLWLRLPVALVVGAVVVRVLRPVVERRTTAAAAAEGRADAGSPTSEPVGVSEPVVARA